jgi:branched-chain amino acid transport system substrate-binding protein
MAQWMSVLRRLAQAELNALRAAFSKAAEAFALVACMGACASPNLEGTVFSCNSDSDCQANEVCAPVGGELGCVAVTEGPIRIGMSAPLQGPSQGLGIEMRRGISAMFQRANQDGGIFGRALELNCMNDNYDPAQARLNTLEMLDVREEVASADAPDRRGPNGVFSILGNVGTPTMLQTAPLADKNRVLFFAPFTGAQQYLRDGTKSPYVYNYRAGYYEEMEAMVDYLASHRQPRVITSPAEESHKRILAFTQNDSYGNAGYEGLVAAYNRVSPLPQPNSALPDPSIRRLYYEREDVASVDDAILQAQTLLTELLGDGSVLQSVAIVMVDTYQPGNKFIRATKDWLNADIMRATQLDVTFMHVSFVGSDSLAAALISAPETYVDVRDGVTRRTYAEGVMVTQVVPYYNSQAPGIAEYRADMAEFDGGPLTFTSLEGYIAARLFVTALKLVGPQLTTEDLLETLDEQVTGVDIGIGTLLGFASTNHQASHTVWGSVIQADGTFQVPFTWNPTARIQPN